MAPGGMNNGVSGIKLVDHSLLNMCGGKRTVGHIYFAVPGNPSTFEQTNAYE
jgi:hypothetical protein